MLSRAGLRYDAALPHSLRQQRLAEGVVDLVSARVGEIFALEKDSRRPLRQRGAQPPGLVHRRRAAHVVCEQAIEFCEKRRILPRLEIGLLEFLDGRHQRFRLEFAAVVAVVAARVRIAAAE